jgi:DNA-binding transcriptional MerR regulator
MAHKQSSLNFDFLPEEDTPGTIPALKETELNIDKPAEPVAETIVRKNILHDETARKSPRGRMKLSEMNAVADQLEIPEDAVLFEKRYYSIGAVSEMFKVNQSLIRYWENEFDILKPKKNGKGDRFFRPEDVKSLKLIYHLLRERKYTIEGAKEFLKKHKNADEKFEVIESLKKLKSFLNELKANL